MTTFNLYQYGLVVASVSGPRKKAWAEICHYALMYSQDGPVQVTESKQFGQKKTRKKQPQREAR